jgi:hypothetical protein
VEKELGSILLFRTAIGDFFRTTIGGAIGDFFRTTIAERSATIGDYRRSSAPGMVSTGQEA